LDQPFGTVTRARISGQRGNPSVALLAAWLQRGLGVPVEVHVSRGPGITAVSVGTDQGEISITRPDGRTARMVRPGFPDREAPLRRRTAEGLIAEELRRLDPDEIYGETLETLPALATWGKNGEHGTRADSSPAGAGKATPRKPAATKTAGRKSAARKPAARRTAATKSGRTSAATPARGKERS
jgi:hypothetical protein